MAASTVNLDAMIEREDMVSEASELRQGAQSRTTMSILDLDGGFFSSGLRKPDFQRETTHWTPTKVAELVGAFVNGDLIPAVILWQRRAFTFVIDGAHRLSALLAWIHDDYGDQSRSIAFFGAQLPPEQIDVAEKTRRLVEKEVGGPYAKFKGLASVRTEVPDKDRRVIEGLSNNSLVVQWVPASDAKTAEDSFFKINQAAQPIDPTERRILQSRESANAIAARCIVRGGKGHSYWGKFDKEIQRQIIELGGDIYDALFKPPLTAPVATLDVPVGGRGYNQLPFAFDLTNLCNGISLPERADTQRVAHAPIADVDGSQTVGYLRNVRKRIQMITTNKPGSLGLHPVVYFYAMSGTFLPNAFLATADFVKRLDERRKINDFINVRRIIEDYIFANKNFISLTVTKLGSGARSLNRLSLLYWRVFEFFSLGRTAEEITNELIADPDFHHLAQTRQPPPRVERGRSGKMSGSTKSAVRMKEGYQSVTRCAICGGAVHFRSQTVDHIVRRSEGGVAHMSNAQITHPYCNTGFKN